MCLRAERSLNIFDFHVPNDLQMFNGFNFVIQQNISIIHGAYKCITQSNEVSHQLPHFNKKLHKIIIDK